MNFGLREKKVELCEMNLSCEVLDSQNHHSNSKMLNVLLSYLIPSVSLGKLHIFQIKRSLITLYQKGTMEKNTLKCPITLEKKTGLFGQIAGG